MAISKNNIKFITSLRIKKFRQKYNKFIVEGDKMLREILLQNVLQIDSLYATDAWIQTNIGPNPLSGDSIFKISVTELGRISSLKTPNQALAVIETPKYKLDEHLLQNDINLYLDDIQDPGNLGTILRIADWFSIAQVICSPGTADIFNPKVIQSSMGAFLRVKTPVTDLGAVLGENKDIPVFGAVLDGENVFTTKKSNSGLIVIGNEGRGISEKIQRLLTQKISIPATGNSGAESLNAAVATGIICALWRNDTG